MVAVFLAAFLQIDSSAVVEMEIIESDESDYEVDFSGDTSPPPETGIYYCILHIPSSWSVVVSYRVVYVLLSKTFNNRTQCSCSSCSSCSDSSMYNMSK